MHSLTGTTADQSKTCSERQWLVAGGLFALGREFHCDMFATILTSASLAACAKDRRRLNERGAEAINKICPPNSTQSQSHIIQFEQVSDYHLGSELLKPP